MKRCILLVNKRIPYVISLTDSQLPVQSTWQPAPVSRFHIKSTHECHIFFSPVPSLIKSIICFKHGGANITTAVHFVSCINYDSSAQSTLWAVRHSRNLLLAQNPNTDHSYCRCPMLDFHDHFMSSEPNILL